MDLQQEVEKKIGEFVDAQIKAIGRLAELLKVVVGQNQPKPQPTTQPPIPMTENQIKYCKAHGLNYSGWDFDRAYREIGQHKREQGLR